MHVNALKGDWSLLHKNNINVSAYKLLKTEAG